jgi:hypothetical protein
MGRDRESRHSGTDFRAARSAAVVARPPLEIILSLGETQVERGGVIFQVIDATTIYPSTDKIRKGLNGQAGRAFALVHKAMERRLPTGAIPGFMLEIIEHPSPGVPAINAIQDRDPNPNARVRAYFLIASGKCVVRAVSGVDRRDERVIHDVFRAEGYGIDMRGSNPASARE